MNNTEYLLVCLMEECSEVAHRASKALRFGLREVQQGQGETNEQRLTSELNDLHGVVEELIKEGVQLNLSKIESAVKRMKLGRVMEYSRAQGCLT